MEFEKIEGHNSGIVQLSLNKKYLRSSTNCSLLFNKAHPCWLTKILLKLLLMHQQHFLLRSIRLYDSLKINKRLKLCCKILHLIVGNFKTLFWEKRTSNAKKHERLYYFGKKASNNKQAQIISSVSQFIARNKILLWHCKLGHLSFSYLRNLFRSLHFDKDFVSL